MNAGDGSVRVSGERVRAALGLLLRPAGAARGVNDGEATHEYFETFLRSRLDSAVGRVRSSGVWGAGGCEILITQRPPGVAKGGAWEFPGGKIEPGESPEEAVVRELLEEVAVSVRPVAGLLVVRHSYAHAEVELHPWVCLAAAGGGEARPVEVAGLRWVGVSELPVPGFLEGNGEIVRSLCNLLN